MKVILLKDEKKLGKAGDIVEVSDGYARNFLLPKKIGQEATAANMQELKQQKAREAKLAAEKLAEAKELAAKLEASQVRVELKLGEGGKVFGSISAKEIAASLTAATGIEVDKKKLLLPEPIKALGTYEVGARLHPQVVATLRVQVVEA